VNSATNETTKPRSLAPLVPTNGAPFFAYLIFLFLVIRPLLLLGDGGTCRHVLTGQYVLHNHTIPSTNYVFAINPSAPWLTHELLSDLILGGAQDLLGLNGVVLIAALAIALVLTWTYQFARVRGLGVISGLLLLIIVMTATSIHWSARAHVFSYVPFLIVYFILFVAELPAKLRYPLLVVTMSAWSNLHGSFVIGLMMIICKLFGDVVSIVISRTTKDADATFLSTATNALKTHALDLVAAFVGISLNLRGLGFLKYVLDYASNPIIRFNSQESRSIDLLAGLPIYAFLALMLIAVFVWTHSRKIPKPAEVLVTVALFVGGLYSMRIMPYFSLIALPVIAGSWPSLKQRILAQIDRSGSKLLKPFAILFSLEEKLDTQESTTISTYLRAYVLFVVGIALWLFIPYFKINDYDPERLPVEATTWLINKKVEGLGFNPDNWGDYLYWRREKPVFIDDKGDFYSPDFDKEYIAIYTGAAGWRDVLDKYKIDWLLLPNALPLVPVLKSDPAWTSGYQDGLVSIFLRRN
jgi:hypothetical protein